MTKKVFYLLLSLCVFAPEALANNGLFIGPQGVVAFGLVFPVIYLLLIFTGTNGILRRTHRSAKFWKVILFSIMLLIAAAILQVSPLLLLLFFFTLSLGLGTIALMFIFGLMQAFGVLTFKEKRSIAGGVGKCLGGLAGILTLCVFFLTVYIGMAHNNQGYWRYKGAARLIVKVWNFQDVNRKENGGKYLGFESTEMKAFLSEIDGELYFNRESVFDYWNFEAFTSPDGETYRATLRSRDPGYLFPFNLIFPARTGEITFNEKGEVRFAPGFENSWDEMTRIERVASKIVAWDLYGM